jgi:endonuclease-3
MTDTGHHILALLRQEYPDIAGTELRHSNPWQLLVATILSAQTTDKLVNMVTKDLFKKYHTVDDYADTPLEDLQEDLNRVNFYRNKAKYIKRSAQMIRDDFQEKVPDEMDALVTLPGVSRKTANVVLSNAFSKHEGVVVDTHVMRLSQRLGLTEEKKREKIEEALMKKFPQDQWFELSNLLITHGRRICTARKPAHEQCVLKHQCPSYEHITKE